MIKLKKCGLVFIFMVLFLPMVVLGDTKKDVKSLFTKDEDGKFYLQTNIVDPDIIISDQCLFTIKDYNDDLMHGDVSFEDWFKEHTSDCKSYFYADILNIYFKHLGFEDNPIYFNYNNPQKDKGFINENGIEYEINISYLDNYDQKEFKKANNIFNGFDKKEDIYGLNLINLVYHYGDIFDLNYKDDNLLARYPKFKKVIEKYYDYDFVSNAGRGGGSPIFNERYVQIGVFKDNILYGALQRIQRENIILLVDKDAEGTIDQKAKRRLEEYFNNKVKIEIILDNEDYGDEFFDEINDALGAKEDYYNFKLATIKMDDKVTYFSIVEVDKKYLDNANFESYDYKSNVFVKSDSYDVPIDSIVTAIDVKDDKKLIEFFDKNNMNVKLAYDLSLKKSFDETLVKKMDNGMEVYFPVDNNYIVGTHHKVYYYNDTNNDEEYDGVVVEENNKKYIKFITNHFSTYVLLSDKINNPATGDNIVLWIVLALMTFFGGCISVNKLLKDNNL